MAGNYFGYAAAPGGTYGTQSGYAAGQAALVAAGQAFAAAAAANARPAFQTYETGPPGPAYAYSARPAVVAVTVGPQYHQAGAATGYDPALYSAAATFYRRQQQGSGKPGTMAQLLNTGSADSMSKKLASPGGHAAKPKDTPRLSQLHFCDVCKIGCLGPQTYREHLEGQRHKKKEAAMTATTAASKTCPTELRCDLCTITCTGADAYAAHIRGSKHLRVLKLYAKLGKPVPDDAPDGGQSGVNAVPLAMAGAPSAAATSMSRATQKPFGTSAAGPSGTSTTASSLRAESVALTKSSDEDSVDTDISDIAAMSRLKGSKPNDKVLSVERQVGSVGQEYVEELRTEDGKVVSFHCKLCNCKFNDPNAKEMHVKGKRHRLQYKKKVDPSLDVGAKASIRKRKLEALQQQSFKEECIPVAWEESDRHRAYLPDETSRIEEDEQLRYGRQIAEVHYVASDQAPHDDGVAQPRWPESNSDRLIRVKHATIYPTEEELLAVQNIVAACEAGLKLVSDHMAAAVPVSNCKDSLAEGTSSHSYVPKEKSLRGVVRVGALAKGLLLSGDVDVELVLLCTAKPTRQVLYQVAEFLPSTLKEVADEDYVVTILPDEAAVRVSRTAPPVVSCTITLTSPVLRLDIADELTVTEPPDVLDRHKCLAALAAHRRAKWFEAKAAPFPACLMVLRILKDMRKSCASLAAINEWAMELLVQRCLSSVPVPSGPSDSFRSLWECIASGFFLPGGPGLADPCERDRVDAAEPLTLQQRDDLTAFAQRSLRMMAFKQLPQLLNMSGFGSDDVTSGTRAKRPRQEAAAEQDHDKSGTRGKRPRQQAAAEQDHDNNAGEAKRIKTQH